jgi:hypothetical protein
MNRTAAAKAERRAKAAFASFGCIAGKIGGGRLRAMARTPWRMPQGGLRSKFFS